MARKHDTLLDMARIYKFRKYEHGYPTAIVKVSHGQYEILNRPNDFLVKYWEKIGPLSGIKSFERLGTFGDLDQVEQALDQHESSKNPSHGSPASDSTIRADIRRLTGIKL